MHEMVRERAGGAPRSHDLLAHWAPQSDPYHADVEDEGAAADPLETTESPPPLFRGQPRYPPLLPHHHHHHHYEEGEGEEEEDEEAEAEDDEEGAYGDKIEWYAPLMYAKACGGAQEAWVVLIRGWGQPYVVVPADSAAADFLVRYALLQPLPPYAAPKPFDAATWARLADYRQGAPSGASTPPDHARALDASLRRQNGVYIHLGGEEEEGGGEGPPPDARALEGVRRDILEPRLVRFMLAPTSRELAGFVGDDDDDDGYGYGYGYGDGEEEEAVARAEEKARLVALDSEIAGEWGEIGRIAEDPRADWLLPVLEQDVLAPYDDDDGGGGGGGEEYYSGSGREEGMEYDDDAGEYVYKPAWREGLAARNPYVDYYVSGPLRRASSVVVERAQALGASAATHFRRLTEEEIDGLGARDTSPSSPFTADAEAAHDMEGARGDTLPWAGGEDLRDRKKEARRAIRAGVQSLLSTFGWADPPTAPPRSASWVPTAGGDAEADPQCEVNSAYTLRVEEEEEEEEVSHNDNGGAEEEEGGKEEERLTDRTASAEELAITKRTWCRMTFHEFACWRCEAQAPVAESLLVHRLLAPAPEDERGGVRWVADALGGDAAALEALRRAARTNLPPLVALGDSMQRLLALSQQLAHATPQELAENPALWESFRGVTKSAGDSLERCVTGGRPPPSTAATEPKGEPKGEPKEEPATKPREASEWTRAAEPRSFAF